MSDGWHVIMTRTRREQAAAAKLGDHGIETFLPLFRPDKRPSNVREGALVALFPSYLFARVSEQIWGAGRHVPEVVKVLPEIVPAGAIAHLRTINDNPWQEGMREPVYYPPGSRLRVNRGPFIGMVAALRSTDPVKRLAVLDFLLGTVEVRLADVELAG